MYTCNFVVMEEPLEQKKLSLEYDLHGSFVWETLDLLN